MPLPALTALAAASSLLASCDRPATAPPDPPAEVRPLSQMCDDNPNPDYPNGFLVVRAPHPRSHFHGLAKSTYASASVPKAIELYYKYNRLVEPLHDHIFTRNLTAMKSAAKAADALAEEAKRAKLERGDPPFGKPAEDLSVEATIQAGRLQIAFLVAALNEDYSGFKNRVGTILAEHPEYSDFYRIREASSPTRIGEGSLHLGASPMTVRSVLLYRLMNDEWAAAERAMIYLLERGATTNPEGFFFPYETETLRARLRRQEASFDQLVFASPTRVNPQPKRCSDLYAFYVEWLDLASRAVVHGGAEDRAAMLLSNVQKLGGVPPPLLGRRFFLALDPIESVSVNSIPTGVPDDHDSRTDENTLDRAASEDQRYTDRPAMGCGDCHSRLERRGSACMIPPRAA